MRISTTHPTLLDPHSGVPPHAAAGPSESGTAETGPIVKEPAPFNMLSAVIALIVCIAITVGIRLASEDSSHWFVVPVLACGVLCAIDVVDWLRGRVDTFDPVAIVGIGSVHFFMTAPLLHVCWGIYLGNTGIIHPPEWRDWLGGMAILNFLGLVIYRLMIAYHGRRKARGRSAGKIWIIDPGRFRNVIWPAMLLTALLQIYIYASFGGVGGYIAEYEAVNQKGHSAGTHQTSHVAFASFGALFTISESFPILAMMAFAVYMRRRGKKISWPAFFAMMAMFLVLKIFFGGLRGSRSETLFGVTFAAGIVHFYLRAIPKKIVFVGLSLMVLYLYLYGFYKNGGLEGIRSLTDSEARGRVAKKIGRSYVSILLGDLGRSDVQGHLLYRFMRPDRDVDYDYGGTYLRGLVVIIPRSIWPGRPDAKRRVLTEAQYGKGTWNPDHRNSSHVTGMAGEAILNFGPYGVPFVFIPFAIIVATVRRWMHTWHPDDGRRLILSYIIVFCFQFLISDLGNDVYSLFKQLLIPGIVLVVATRRIPLSRYQAATLRPTSFR